MDLLDLKRRLLCASKLFRQSGSGFERRGPVEILVLLFDNYREFIATATNSLSAVDSRYRYLVVMAKPMGKRSDAKFQVYKRVRPRAVLSPHLPR